MSSQIRFLSRRNIDATKWDACVAASPHGLVYGLSWYLDLVAPHWTGLVLGDYEAVFPLPVNRKLLGLPQVYAPLLCQQLGPFARLPHPTDAERFLTAGIRGRFFWRFALHLNEAAQPPVGPRWQVQAAPNFVLPLDRPHNVLWAGYSDNHRRNVRKALRAGLVYDGALDVSFFVKKIKTYQAAKGNNIPETLYPMAEKLLAAALDRNAGRFVTATAPDGNLHAAAFFLHWKNRWIDLLNLTMPEGRDTGAMHGLIDHLVHQRADTGDLLDFEGSSMANLARFYQGFGAEERTFWKVHRV